MVKTATKRAPQPRSAKKAAPKPAARASTKRSGPTKADIVFQMLSRSEGVSLAELVKKLGVLEHSARAYISVEARKRTGKKAVLSEGRYRLG